MINNLQKETTFKWRPEQEQAFQELKRSFITVPFIKYFNHTKPVTLETNGLNYVVVGIPNAKYHKVLDPVAYNSHI